MKTRKMKKFAMKVADYTNAFVTENPTLNVIKVEVGQALIWTMVKHTADERGQAVNRLQTVLAQSQFLTVHLVRETFRFCKKDVKKAKKSHELAEQIEQHYDHLTGQITKKIPTPEAAVQEVANKIYKSSGVNMWEFLAIENKNLRAGELKGATRAKMIRDLCELLPPSDEGKIHVLIGNIVTKLLGGDLRTNKDTAKRLHKEKKKTPETDYASIMSTLCPPLKKE